MKGRVNDVTTHTLTTSALITTYNGERFIEAQLDSIRRQTKKIDQLLIFDDGSNDSTTTKIQEFIAKYELNGWVVTVNHVNLGPADNVLTHLADLAGDLVFLADQDDIWDESKVEILSSFMTLMPEASMVVSSSTIIDDKGHPIEDPASIRALHRRSRVHRRGLVEAEELGFDDFLGSSSVPLHAMCVRGDVLRDISRDGNFPDLSKSLGADWYIGIWSTTLGSVMLTPERLVFRRIHDSNISLGSLRKTNILASTSERRSEILKESFSAHQAILENANFTSRLSRSQIQSLEQMTKFLKLRIAYASNPSVSKTFGLIVGQMRCYQVSAGTVRGALRMWVADVMYAYNINWKIKRRG